MITKRYAELLTILKDAPSGLSTADIFKIASGNLKSLIPDPGETSRMIYNLRAFGNVETSGDKKKVHKITPKGLSELAEFKNEIKETRDMAPIPSVDSQNKNSPVVDGKAMEVESSESANGDHEQLEAEEGALSGDSALETLARDGYMVLDPMSEADQFICEVVTRLKQPATPAPLLLDNKAEKIGVLNLLKAHYGYVNSDFETMLSDIINDLERMEAA